MGEAEAKEVEAVNRRAEMVDTMLGQMKDKAREWVESKLAEQETSFIRELASSSAKRAAIRKKFKKSMRESAKDWKGTEGLDEDQSACEKEAHAKYVAEGISSAVKEGVRNFLSTQSVDDGLFNLNAIDE